MRLREPGPSQFLRGVRFMQGGPLKVLHPEAWLDLLWTVAGGGSKTGGRETNRG